MNEEKLKLHDRVIIDGMFIRPSVANISTMVSSEEVEVCRMAKPPFGKPRLIYHLISLDNITLHPVKVEDLL